MKHFLTILFLAGILVACKKETKTTIPEDIASLSQLQEKYKQQLVAAADGWIIDYQPASGQGKVAIWVKFNADGTANILSDYNGYTTEQANVRYRIGGVNAPELIFETYSAWHAIAENMGGAFEFVLAFNSDGSASLKRIN